MQLWRYFLREDQVLQIGSSGELGSEGANIAKQQSHFTNTEQTNAPAASGN